MSQYHVSLHCISRLHITVAFLALAYLVRVLLLLVLVLVLSVLLEVRALEIELNGVRVGMFCLGRVVLALCRVTGLWSCVARRFIPCWLEESPSTLLLVGVPAVPCSRGLLS